MHQVLLDTAYVTLVQDTAHVVLYIVHPGRLVSEVLAYALLALMFVDVLQAVAVAGRRRQLCDLRQRACLSVVSRRSYMGRRLLLGVCRLLDCCAAYCMHKKRVHSDVMPTNVK